MAARPVGPQDESPVIASADPATGVAQVSPPDTSADGEGVQDEKEDGLDVAAESDHLGVEDEAGDLDDDELGVDDDLDNDLDDDLDLDDEDLDDEDDLDVKDEADDLDDDDLDDDDLDVEDEADELDDDEPVTAPLSGRRARAAAERAAAEKKAPPNKKDATKPGTKPGRNSDLPSTKNAGSAKPTRAAAGTGNRRSLMRFLREVIAELGKVVWPGRRELIVYTSVVIVFMIFMVSLVAGLDILFAQGVLAVFG